MNKLTSFTLTASALVFGATVTATAAPLTPSAPSVDSITVQVHGRHRSCDGGPRWQHRHNWRGERLSCGRDYRGDRGDRGRDGVRVIIR